MGAIDGTSDGEKYIDSVTDRFVGICVGNSVGNNVGNCICVGDCVGVNRSIVWLIQIACKYFFSFLFCISNAPQHVNMSRVKKNRCKHSKQKQLKK